jgi:hypothetical protein
MAEKIVEEARLAEERRYNNWVDAMAEVNRLMENDFGSAWSASTIGAGSGSASY